MPVGGRGARPFVKWAGGKAQLLKQFELYFPGPAQFGRYFEPFLGGGAVFFHLRNTGQLPDQVFLFDTNDELINAYQIVRDQIDDLIALLAVHQARHSHDYYYQIRDIDRRSNDLTVAERAARTIYLNRTCYNGLSRVNSQGQFNVPMGSYRNPRIAREAALRAASAALQGVCVETRDFGSVVELARPGDFFYFDPPYDPVSRTASFTSYTAGNFRDEDQRRLAAVYAELSRKGCLCMLSNSYTPFIVDLYREFRLETVQASRPINSDAGGRGAIKEAVVLNY
jgi:DNA adenine methylase